MGSMMTREQQLKQRTEALRAVQGFVAVYGRGSPPSYKFVSAQLNQLGVKTTWGNNWTPKRVFRFLQRMGYSGLHGIQAEQQGRNRQLQE